MSTYRNHALREFMAMGWVDQSGKWSDPMQQEMCEHVLSLLDVFRGEGHSGTSAPYAVDLFSKLAMFKPLGPLTGEDWEWVEICDDRTNNVTVYQNNRDSRVFKQSDRFNGQPYFLDGKIFWEWCTDPETGEHYKSHYTCSESFVPIEFPYYPTSEYVERPSGAE